MFIPARAERLQAQQAKFVGEKAAFKSPVVVVVLSLLDHGSHSHAEPRVELLEHPTACGERFGKVVRRTPDDSVKLLDDGLVEVVVSDGDLLDLGLEFLH